MDIDAQSRALERAAEKNDLALNVLAQGRLRDALDAINKAIVIAPAYPHSYANRALIFEQMGMQLQADAERRRARELALAAGYTEEEVFAPSIAPPPAPRQTPRPRAAVRPRPVVPGGLLAAVVAILIFAGLTVGAGLALLAVFSDSANKQASPGADRASPSPVRPSPSPPELAPSSGGAPFSFTSLQKSWQARGIAVTPGQASPGFSGFQIVPLGASLRRSSGSAQLAAFVYKNADSAQQDWNLVPGSRPAPKAGRTLPLNTSIWWNANIVVVVLAAPEDLSADALDAFLNLSP